MQNRTLPSLAVAAACLLFCELSPALAQVPPAIPQPVLRQQDEILQRNEQERRERERRRELEMLRPTGTPLGTPAQPSIPTGEGACFEAQTITVGGNTRLSEGTLKRAVAPFEGRCLSMEDLNGLLKGLTDVYMERGYVATRVYVPEQDISSGQLRLEVMEGSVAGIILNEGEGGWMRWRLATAFPWMEGAVPDLRAIEQGLDQMNRARSVDTTMELRPGEQPGETLIAVSQERGKPWYGTLGFDNSGDKSTGVWRANAGFGFANMAGINDVWSLSASHTLPDKPRLSSRSLSGSVSIPWGWWTVSLSGSTFTYHSLIATPAQSFKSRGHSHTASFNVDRTLDRDDAGKTIARVGLTRKWSMSYIDDVRLLTGDRDLSVLSLGLDHSRRLGGGLLSLGVGYERGLRILGAMKDQTSHSEVPKAQFDKFTADINYYLPFQLMEQDFAYSLYAHGQLSPDTLYSSERIGIASSGAVRGFKDGSLMGDSGLFVRNELRWTLPFEPSVSTRAMGTPSLYLGLDRGGLKKDTYDPYERGSVTGAALGLRSSGNSFSFDLSGGRVLSAPCFMEKEKSFYANVTLLF